MKFKKFIRTILEVVTAFLLLLVMGANQVTEPKGWVLILFMLGVCIINFAILKAFLWDEEE